MGRVLFRINIDAITEHTWPWPLSLTLFLDLWPWHLTLRLICYCLDDLKKKLQTNNIWSHVTPKWYVVRRSAFDSPHRYFFKEYFATNKKSLLLPVPKLWLKRWFSWFLTWFTLTLTFSLNIFIRLPTSKNAYKWLSKTKTYRYIYIHEILKYIHYMYIYIYTLL